MNNDKIILSVATTGSRPSKLQNPGLPVTPEEIAQAAVESWREGAAVVHVHVRDEAGKMTCDLSLPAGQATDPRPGMRYSHQFHYKRRGRPCG